MDAAATNRLQAAGVDVMPSFSPQPKGESKLMRRYKKRAAEQKAERDAYRAVNVRDGYKCRACGKRADPRAIDSLARGHHHHVTFRSQGGTDTTSNICLVCPMCHADIHAHALRLELLTEQGADGPLAVWVRNDAGEYLSRREVAVHQVERD